HRHDGVQVLGDPGVGKSSLVRRISADTARAWLAGEAQAFVPVPVNADRLTGRGGLPDLLARGVVGTVHLDLEGARLAELFGAEPVPGVPWLVLVDGLDEVLSTEDRLTVLDLVRRFREESGHRFLLASRPVGRQGFAGRVDESRHPTYVLEPFTDWQLHRFVTTWLSTAEHPEPEAGAAEFLSGLAGTRLHELAHVPLVASMLCLLFAAHPDRPLPEGQAELYGAFTGWLRQKLAESGADARLRAMLPHAAEAVDEVRHRVEELARFTAYGHQRTGEPLGEIAARWPGVRPPAHVSARQWAEVLTAVLRASGLVVERPGGARFLHQTVEEYLAGCHLVEQHRDAREVLEPQRDWPWSDLQTRLFFAARWVETGRDLAPALRKLLGFWHWPRNIGFVVELVRHGVPVPEAQLRRAVRMLDRAASDRNRLTLEAWQQYVVWLAELDRPRAQAAVNRIVRGGRGGSGRLWLLTFLLKVDPEAADRELPGFLGDPEVSEEHWKALARQVIAVRGAADFTRLAFARGESWPLSYDVLAEQGVEGEACLADIATDAAQTWPTRLRAARTLAGVRSPLAVPTLLSLTAPEVREKAMLALHGLPDAEPALLDLFHHGESPADRYWAAVGLNTRFNHPTDVLVRCAEDRSLAAALRLELASRLTSRNHPAGWTLLAELSTTLPQQHSEQRLAAAEMLADKDHGAALQLLAEDKTVPQDVRVTVAVKLAKHRRTTAIRLLKNMVTDRGVREGLKLYIANQLHELTGDATWVAGMATSRSLPTETRLKLINNHLSGPDAMAARGDVLRHGQLDTRQRLELAEQLLPHDRATALAALERVEADRRAPQELRDRARRLRLENW
ncbi:NACHT domain-containing protein, partial [Crossiella equi]